MKKKPMKAQGMKMLAKEHMKEGKEIKKMEKACSSKKKGK